jgi:hypothetical protein
MFDIWALVYFGIFLMIKRDFFGYSLLQNTVLVYKENMTMIGQHLGDFFSQTHLVTLALILE